jgi:type I restriction enzyme S subunit
MQTRTLANLIEEHGGIVQTGPFGSQLHQADYTDEGVPVIMTKDIVGGRVNESTVARIPEEKAMQLSRHLLKAGDIVFPRRGEIGKCALIDEAQEGFFCGTGCLKIGIPQEVYSSRFLYYYLGLRKTIEWLERNAAGTTMLNLSAKIVGNLQVPMVDMTTQNHIAGILSTYDNLIENNRRRIQLLEQAARLLYKEWFVHLRFPGHEHVKIVDGVPEGWEKKPLGEITTLNYGKALKKDNRIPGPFPVYGSSGVVGTHEKALIPGPGIIVGRKGNVGSVYWCEEDFHPIDTAYFINSDNSTHHLYYALLYTSFINTDVAVPGLNRDFAHSRKILIPNNTIGMLFEETVTPIHKQLHGLQKYNETLAQARDILLPRLMNGEVAV